MRCQICQKNEMTMKITKIVAGVPTEYNVCDECASKVSHHHAKIMKKKAVDKQDAVNLLKELLEHQGAAAIKVESVEEELPVCPECGLDYLRFRQTFMLGCPACYDAFGELLLSDIRKIHGSDKHVDASPEPVVVSRRAELQGRLRASQRDLAESVEQEDFDRAARLRDEVKKLQEELEAELEKGNAEQEGK